MTSAVTGLDPGEVERVIPESLRELIREAARRSAPKVRQALSEKGQATIERLPYRPRDS
jgi:hypothetical protein